MIVFFIGCLCFLALFCALYYVNPYRVANGFLFDIAVVLAGCCVVLLGAQHPNLFFSGLFFILLALAAFLLVFGVYLLIILLFINAGIMLRRERHSAANLLTLFLAIGLCVCMALLFAKPQHFPWPLQLFLGALAVLLLFYLVHAVGFFSAWCLACFYPARKNKDFIIVLGSGLLDGDRVPPLLAGRIDRAIRFYEKQKKARPGRAPKLLFSGGQGVDETLPEAVAMQRYAIAKGVPEADTLAETQSVNTAQNMAYSKRIMDEAMGGARYRCLFCTSNYHLFRAGLYARGAGLRCHGIGARTALYYLPTALLREYIAVVLMHKKKNLILSLLVLAFAALAAFVLFLFSR